MLSHAPVWALIVTAATLWIYLMGAAVTAAMAIANLIENLQAVRRNPQNHRRAKRAMVSSAALATCWAWPVLLILWTVSGSSPARAGRTAG